MTTSIRLRPGLVAAAWTLVVSSGTGVLLCLGVAGTGCWAIASDLSTRGERWDGMGLLVGGLLLLVATVLGVICWSVAWGATRGLRALRAGGHGTALTPTSLAATAVGWLVTVYVTGDLEPDPLALVVQSVAWGVALSGTLTLVLSLAAGGRAPHGRL